MVKFLRIALIELRKFFSRLIKNNGISALVSLALIIAVWQQNSSSTSLVDWLDFSVLSSVVFALIITSISVTIEKYIVNHIEDVNKLTQNYDTLSKRYVNKLFTFENSLANGVNRDNLNILLREEGKSKDKNKIDTFKMTFPIAEVTNTYENNFVINDSTTNYELPAEVQDNHDDIFKAHDGSTVYNQQVIRVDDFSLDRKTFSLSTSRSSYFNSLVTNRSMDYEWENGLTNRKLYDYGPFVTPLIDSKLSNHLGFNGFVQSKDGYIPFMLRSKDVSMAKNTYSPSVTASLKVKYALHNNQEFTVDGLKAAIVNEIADELKIEATDLEVQALNEHVVRFYRDMVEGGKPQLMFYIKSTQTKDEIDEQFHAFHKEKKNGKNRFMNRFDLTSKMLEDGNKLVWIPKSNLKTIAIAPGYFIYSGKKYNSTPSYTSNIAMLINHLQNIGEIE